jgi:hypothetical protein
MKTILAVYLSYQFYKWCVANKKRIMRDWIYGDSDIVGYGELTDDSARNIFKSFR